MLRFSVSRSWKHLIRIQPDLASFLELNSMRGGVCVTLLRVRVELTSGDMTASRMVVPVKDLNALMVAVFAEVESLAYSSLEEMVLKYQASLLSAIKVYAQENARPDLRLAGFEFEFENAMVIKVKNDELELQERFDLKVMHELETDGVHTHGHDMRVGVALAFKSWMTHPSLTSLKDLSLELKDRARRLLVEPLNLSKLNRSFKAQPTGEQIAAQFFAVLEKTKLGPFLKEVRVFETQKNQYSAREI